MRLIAMTIGFFVIMAIANPVLFLTAAHAIFVIITIAAMSNLAWRVLRREHSHLAGRRKTDAARVYSPR